MEQGGYCGKRRRTEHITSHVGPANRRQARLAAYLLPALRTLDFDPFPQEPDYDQASSLLCWFRNLSPSLPLLSVGNLLPVESIAGVSHHIQ